MPITCWSYSLFQGEQEQAKARAGLENRGESLVIEIPAFSLSFTLRSVELSVCHCQLSPESEGLLPETHHSDVMIINRVERGVSGGVSRRNINIILIGLSPNQSKGETFFVKCLSDVDKSTHSPFLPVYSDSKRKIIKVSSSLPLWDEDNARMGYDMICWSLSFHTHTHHYTYCPLTRSLKGDIPSILPNSITTSAVWEQNDMIWYDTKEPLILCMYLCFVDKW